MTVDVDRFTGILAERLAAIVPEGFHVQPGDGMLWYSADDQTGLSGTHVRDNFGVCGETDGDNLVGLAVQALDELHAWYADNGAVVLGCAPIPLADLES